ncbi:small-subunit processome [Kockovaella imperatae]|uniref:Small-subunit processome n=1 Tax=Kockovaella imperatae TaxID=4999 RepID=A0A1Y1UR51_9TREE|nr:small-subunit processome [Kockovaella imperatae]ORX39615.1 small-subunit processome [Kockovaella imperatae]
MDDLDPSTLDGLDAFVDRLTASSKDKDGKATSSEPVAPEKKRRVLETIPGPALDGNELGLKSRQKLDLSTLIASHPSLSSASALLPTKTKPKDSYKTGSILKQGTLSAPLPTSVQDRLNREAAYEATKEEGAKWAGVMKRIKEAEHLSFPLQAEERGGVKSSGALLSEYKPRQGLESAVQSLLARANLTQDGITKRENEALESQELSVEEMEERRKRLREQRELIFRAETRAKRVARIKSKTFRKLARKRAAKAAGAEDLDETLESMDAEDRAEALEKAEMDRARERATLKHGARTSRWARQAGGSGMGMTGEEGRIAKEDMLEMKRKLSRRIQGRGDDSGGSDDSDEEGDEDNENEEEEEEGGEEAIKRRAFDQLAKVANGSNGDTAEASGLMGMAFMKKAEQRQKRKAAEEEESLKRDIEMFGDLDEVDSQGSNEEDDGTMMNVGGTGGRMVFSGPSRSSQSSGIQKPPLPQTSAVSGDTSKPKVRFESSWTANQEDEQLNPWLAQPTSSIGPSRKRQHGIGANSSAADKTVQSLKKAVKGSSTAEDDSRVEISLNPDAQPGQQDGDESGGDESDGDRMGTVPRKRVRLGQRDLVAEAFAGDNVVEDFAAEKARTIEEDAPKVEDTTLPGWGLWGGKGLKKRKSNPSRLVTKPGIDPLTRQDAKRDNVIISEKKDKKASKYLVKDLPYPYTSKAQYEKRFENPLGAEWNSRSGHQRETLPRVVRKPGAIIEPVRRLF